MDVSTTRDATSPGAADARRSAARAMLTGGLTAGVLDILYAMAVAVSRGGSPVRVLQGIGSGVLGVQSFRLGLTSAMLGLVAHFVIAFGATLVYYVASRRLAILRTRPLVSGVLYGVAVYLVMNFIVVPLSAVPAGPPPPFAVRLAIFVAHPLCVGVPIALCVNRYAPLVRH